MELLRLVLAAVILCCAHAYLTGAPCRDPHGRFAYRWSQCHLCSVQTCRCVLHYGHGLRADCDRVRATSVRPPPGCHVGGPVYDGADINCCPILCSENPLLESCLSSFGTSFSEGETWGECIPGKNCCSLRCECVRINARLTRQCEERCHRVEISDPRCRIVEPFQNSTVRDCCRVECPTTALETCVSSFGERFQESETWTECSPGRSCCTKSCECVRQGSTLSPLCFEACPGIQLLPGCTIIEPFQNATHRECCRTQCSTQRGA
ncbi:von Willebrand factor-like [Liolophura sinensis]|uniref:von Willebrand factor-like n=1 Tax=Liolophura sinensis TaxID=3198878 RepID=UPI0031589B59